jgi:glycosyltransferase involved in cell wall biosynthesis
VKKLKVLMSAYACVPHRGSEPGAGWSFAREMANHHEVWVITRLIHRELIEQELLHDPAPQLHVVYFDFPQWLLYFKQGALGTLIYYYFWQLGAYRVARKLRRHVTFDLVHHVTFGSFWMPSLMPLIGGPFIWGPVGGGESTPRDLWSTLDWRGQFYEALRQWTQRIGEYNPLVRLPARRSAIALVTTEDTAKRVRAMGATNVREFYQVGLGNDEIEQLGALKPNKSGVFRLLSCGRLLGWKGFDLALSAFAQSGLCEAQYWIIGDGPERQRLQRHAEMLGISDRVAFWGALPRETALRQMGECDVLVHPSLHDSGGVVCLEAMAARKPVICLDTGGPGVQVTEQTGFPIPPARADKVIGAMSDAMKTLADDAALRVRLGTAARQRVIDRFSFSSKCAELCEIYELAFAGPASAAASNRAAEADPARAARATASGLPVKESV